MKLYLTRQQAEQLGTDLLEYIKMKDSSNRELFSGFEVSFPGMLSEKQHGDQSLEMLPMAEFTEISKDTL